MILKFKLKGITYNIGDKVMYQEDKITRANWRGYLSAILELKENEND